MATITYSSGAKPHIILFHSAVIKRWPKASWRGKNLSDLHFLATVHVGGKAEEELEAELEAETMAELVLAGSPTV